LHKDIAIGFLKATGFRNKPKRTIFDVWCGDPSFAARIALLQSEQAFRQALNTNERDEYSYSSLAALYLSWAKKVSIDAAYISKNTL
jgi:hypothetical protein